MTHYSHRHMLLTVNGQLGTPNPFETWTWGLRFMFFMDGSNTTGPVPTAGQQQAWLAEASAPTVSYFGTVCSDPARLTHLKLALVETDGHYISSPDSQTLEYPEPVDPGPVAPYPWQVALATTTETGRRRGLAHRGRWYTPLPRYGVAPDGLIQAADAISAAEAAKAWLNALRGISITSPGALEFTAVPHVFSAGATAQSPMESNEITGVSVGRRLDIIRSRGRSQDESRQFATL